MHGSRLDAQTGVPIVGGRRSDDDVTVRLRPDGARPGRCAPRARPLVTKSALQSEDLPARDEKTLEVSMRWHGTVMQVAHFPDARRVCVGEDRRNDLQIAHPLIPTRRFPLVDLDGGRFVVHWSPGMRVAVRGGDGVIRTESRLEASGRLTHMRTKSGRTRWVRYAMGLHDRVAVRLGDVTFAIQFVSTVQRPFRGRWRALDVGWAGTLFLSLLIHVLLGAALWRTPIVADDPGAFASSDRFVRLLGQVRRAETPKAGAPTLEFSGVIPTQLTRKDPVAGKRTSPNRPRLVSRRLAYSSRDRSPRERRNRVSVAPALSPLQGLRGGTTPLSRQSLKLSPNRGESGQRVVDSRESRTVLGESWAQGCLSQREVERVVRSEDASIRHCYEVALRRNPGLRGTITAQFLVRSTGSVTQAKVESNDMDSRALEKCISGVVRKLRFPACAGGGTARVRYPWRLRPTL